MNYKIEDIEGIGPAMAGKLAAAKIKTTDNLLDVCSSSKGRKEVAGATGLSEKQLLKWANMADLMRIKGIGGEYDLGVGTMVMRPLEHGVLCPDPALRFALASGVDTVKELKMRKAGNLATKMAEVNETKKLTRTVPSEKVVQGWVEQAAALPPKISH